ncbi:MAG TPA: VIT1/CCC1 transporter family protein [Candidatus Saccharimonadales bacterium]|nr:VIT1/CCC1 transporter family protein [Candidatus Saccharimonadales bacterium]
MEKMTPHDILNRRALQIQRGAARAAVLGVNDGLVSILCIVLAVAGAGAHSSSVLLAGFAGLIAGAISMAAGEWISVRAQVELFEGVLKDIHHLIHDDKTILVSQIAKSLEEGGQSKKTAERSASEMAEDHRQLIKVYARQVMGFNPDELGSPWLAALSSFALFTLGALAPLAPWVFIGGSMAIWISIGLTGVGSLIVGGYIGVSSGKNRLYGAVRQLAIVALASVVTYGIGYIFGVSVG